MTVYLVGAGPGDPGLLTIKARDLLAECDVIVYDYLVNPELLRYARKNVESIPVWKIGGASGVVSRNGTHSSITSPPQSDRVSHFR